jgi:DNA-binding PadR family transcriptional regulator
MDPGLKRIIDKAESMMEDQVARITMNIGHKAHADLDKMDGVVNRVRWWLEDADADYGYDATEDAKELLQELKDQIEETQRELDDRELLDDDVDEDRVMEYMEDRVYELEKVVEEFGRLR